MANVILIGYMGCGKTTIGRKLSYRFRKPFLDTDKQIELKQKCSISEIFAEQGEQAFRDLETNYLKDLLKDKCEYIISVGGGLPLREENQKLLQKLGTCVYLEASADTIYERLKHDTSRPLLQCDDPKKKIQEMLEIRTPIYKSCADLVISVDGKRIEEIVVEVKAEVEKRNENYRNQRSKH